MFCQKCGAEMPDGAAFCPSCGAARAAVEERTSDNNIRCPICGSCDIDMQVQQENKGSATTTRTKSKYKQKGHGFIWWLFIGWWWWIVDLMLWIYIFPIRFLIQLFKKKKYVGDSTSVTSQKSKIVYKTVCLCKSCGHHWVR